MSVLLREAIGDRLRHARTNQRRTLREVSRTARVSLGYLSEVERGQKEASSELLAAICDALELPLSELLYNVANDMREVDPAELLEPATGGAGQTAAQQGADEARMSAAGIDGVAGMDGVARPIDTGDLLAGAGIDAGHLLGDAVVGDSLADLRIQPALTHRIGPEIARASVFAA